MKATSNQALQSLVSLQGVSVKIPMISFSIDVLATMAKEETGEASAGLSGFGDLFSWTLATLFNSSSTTRISHLAALGTASAVVKELVETCFGIHGIE